MVPSRTPIHEFPVNRLYECKPVKTRPFGLKMVKFEADKNHLFHTKRVRVFLLICPQLFSSIVLSK